MDWLSLIQTLGGVAGGWGIGMFTKSGRRRDKADADSKVMEAQRRMIDNYEERIKDLHSNISQLNEAERGYIERISEQNKALNDKTEQIRNLTDKLWNSEQTSNHINASLDEANKRIALLIEERDEWMATTEYYKQWHCRSAVCIKGNPDPEGRQPPNPKLKGQTFIDPANKQN